MDVIASSSARRRCGLTLLADEHGADADVSICAVGFQLTRLLISGQSLVVTLKCRELFGEREIGDVEALARFDGLLKKPDGLFGLVVGGAFQSLAVSLARFRGHVGVNLFGGDRRCGLCRGAGSGLELYVLREGLPRASAEGGHTGSRARRLERLPVAFGGQLVCAGAQAR